MIKKYERMLAQMPDGDVALLAATAARVAARRDDAHLAALAALLDGDFERVDAAGPITPDGREVLTCGGVAIALRTDAHAERMARAFEAARQRRKGAQSKPGPGESLTSVLCPVCISTMAKSPVCPNCAPGRAGYKILCICTECAHEVYL